MRAKRCSSPRTGCGSRARRPASRCGNGRRRRASGCRSMARSGSIHPPTNSSRTASRAACATARRSSNSPCDARHATRNGCSRPAGANSATAVPLSSASRSTSPSARSPRSRSRPARRACSSPRAPCPVSSTTGTCRAARSCAPPASSWCSAFAASRSPRSAAGGKTSSIRKIGRWRSRRACMRAKVPGNHAESISCEYRVQHKNGRYVWVWDNCVLVRDRARPHHARGRQRARHHRTQGSRSTARDQRASLQGGAARDHGNFLDRDGERPRDRRTNQLERVHRPERRGTRRPRLDRGRACRRPAANPRCLAARARNPQRLRRRASHAPARRRVPHVLRARRAGHERARRDHRVGGLAHRHHRAARGATSRAREPATPRARARRGERRHVGLGSRDRPHELDAPDTSYYWRDRGAVHRPRRSSSSSCCCRPGAITRRRSAPMCCATAR